MHSTRQAPTADLGGGGCGHFGRLLLATALAVSASMPAAAAVCAKASTTASGPAGYFQFVAANKARIAWSRKVQRTDNLGMAFSRWAAARNGRVTCRVVAQRHRCVAVAEPCRSDRADVQSPAGKRVAS